MTDCVSVASKTKATLALDNNNIQSVADGVCRCQFSMAVFFNLFSEVEPFAAILFAQCSRVHTLSTSYKIWSLV